MKTFFLKKNFFSYILILAFFAASPFFLLMPKHTASATEGSISIAGPDTVSIDTSNFQLTAILKNSQVYTARNIFWTFEINGILSTSISSNVGIEVNNSVATFPKSLYPTYPNEVGLATAAITNNGSIIYRATWQVFFTKNTRSNITPKPVGNVTMQSYNESGDYAPFQIQIEEAHNPNSLPVLWLMLSSNGKYVPQTNLNPNQNIFSFKPEKPGKYSFKAKIGEIFTNAIDLTVRHLALGKMQLNHTLKETTRHGLNIYLFELESINEEAHDVEFINWYRKGHSTPLQYGGSTFLFEPIAYGTYQIYAKYENPDIAVQNSNEILLEIKIDRIKEIIWFGAILVGLLAVGLVVIIRRNIKQDRVW